MVNSPLTFVGYCALTGKVRAFTRCIGISERKGVRPWYAQHRPWPELLAHVECLRGTREFGLVLPDDWREGVPPRCLWCPSPAQENNHLCASHAAKAREIEGDF